MAVVGTYGTTKRHLIENFFTDIVADDGYVRDGENFVYSSTNNHQGADVMASAEDKNHHNIHLNGYIKDNILHFSVVEFGVYYCGLYNPYVDFNITSVNHAKYIKDLLEKYGEKHNISEFTNLSIKIDWKDIFSKRYWNNMELKYNTPKNMRIYKKALSEFDLGTSDYHKLQEISKGISKSITHNDGLTNSSINSDLAKANMYLKSALYKKKHLSFVKQQKDNKAKQVAR